MAYLCILGAAFLWALLGTTSKFLLQRGMEPLEVAFWRSFIAGIFFAAQVFYSNEWRIRKKDLGIFIPFGLIGITLFYVAFQNSVSRSGAAMASILLYTAPTWVGLLSVLVLKEKLSPKKALSILLAFAGICGIFAFGSAESLKFDTLGIGWGLIAGFTYGLFYIVGKMWLKGFKTSTVFFYLYLFGTLGYLPMFYSISIDWNKPALDWVIIGILGFLCTYVPSYLYFTGLRVLDPVRASLLATIEPVLSCIFAFFIWGETFSVTSYFCSALVILGVVIGVTSGTNVRVKNMFAPFARAQTTKK